MPHHTPLIATIVGAIVIAFVFGALAQRLRLPPLIGYLLAGVAVGPFTPGFVADQGLAAELSDAMGRPGTTLDDQLTIACGTGAIRPTLVQRAGRPAMATADLLRGRPIPAGTRIG